ncbi:MAG: hypothetical protein JWO50_574 [Candidatus Kaiserbacteria bacterium]|nr:hypothetical protein [Candidatus Kaiserbacteria bacterium]
METNSSIQAIETQGIRLVVCFSDKDKVKIPITLENPHEDKLKAINAQGYGIFETANSFFATHEQLRESGAKTKRNKEFLTKLNAVFADLDVCKDDEKISESDRESRKTDLKMAFTAHCSPSVWIITKNGLQPLWWLNEDKIDTHTQERYKNVVNGVIQWSIKYGSKGDPVKDVTRVLRKPGYYHNKSEPYLITEENGNGKTYTITELEQYFPYTPSQSKAEEPVSQKNTEASADREGFDIQQTAIDVWAELGKKAEFNKQGHLVIDGVTTATFKGRQGDGNYIATTSSDFPAKGNAITYVAETLKIDNKEAYKWLCNKYPDQSKRNNFAEKKPDIEEKTKKICTMRWSELDALEFPSNRWRIPNLIPKAGIVILASISGEGKTWMAMEFAKCISSGAPLFGEEKYPTQQGRVLYVDAENGKRQIQSRGRQLGMTDSDNLIFLPADDINLNDDAWAKELIETIHNQKIDVVIIDTFRAVAGGLEEQKAEEIRKFFNRYKKMRENNVCFIWLDHLRKPERFDGGVPKKEHLLGSQDKAASVDILLMMKKTNDSITIYQRKNRLDKEIEPFKVDMVDDESQIQRKTSLIYNGEIEEKESKISEAIEYIPSILIEGPQTTPDIKRICQSNKQIGQRNVQDALKSLLTSNIIGKRKKGKRDEYFMQNEVSPRPELVEPDELQKLLDDF